MSMIISDILKNCQNDKEYLKEIIDNLTEIYENMCEESECE